METFVKYYLSVEIKVMDGYTTIMRNEVTHSINVELPITAAGSLDLNAVATGLLEDCKAEIVKLQQKEDE